jgi:hypothetical protein
MPGKWNRYEGEADEGKSAIYMIGGCHDVEGDNPQCYKMEDSLSDSIQ